MNTRYFSKRQETAIAKKLSGKRQSNSGATPFQKGDVITDDWLIEAKTCVTEKQSFSVKREWLEKNKEEAFAMNRHYRAVAIDFGDGQNYYIVDEKTFIAMRDALKQQEAAE